jgi:hypothetical protein
MSLKLSPLAKHDLLLSDSLNVLTSPEEVFATWRSNPAMKSHKVAVVYTYQEDSPKTLLSSKLDVLGYCPLHLASSLLKLSDQWHSCHLGVKRADGAYQSTLNPEALQNSSDFASFVKNQLFHPCQAAILGCDSKGRCGIITCTLQDVRNASYTALTPHKEEYSGWEYFASCYVISFEELYKSTLKVVASIPLADSQHQGSKSDNVPLWKPPETAEDDMTLHSQMPMGSIHAPTVMVGGRSLISKFPRFSAARLDQHPFMHGFYWRLHEMSPIHGNNK